jgi:phytoene desaturase (3,4-didehydrolycopene-forming)
LKPHSDVLDAFFESNKMRALASFQDLYVGLEPYRNDKLVGGGILKTTAPAVFGLLAAIELHPHNNKCGVFAPIGGFGAVTTSLERLATNRGVELMVGKTVTRVDDSGLFYRNPDKTESFLSADLVVINADLPYATKVLINDEEDNREPRYDWVEQEPGRPRYEFSSGVVAFHWSIDKELLDLNTHNVFLAAKSRSDAEQSWKVIRDKQRGSLDSINFYVHRAGKTDPTAAPDGCDAVMVLVPTEPLSRIPECATLSRDEAILRYKEQFGAQRIDEIRKAVLHRFSTIESLRELQSHILDEVVETPATYADKYNVAAGVPFALGHGFAQLSLTRPGPLSGPKENTLFVGASTRPGNGVPLVLMGANKVAQCVISRLL